MQDEQKIESEATPQSTTPQRRGHPARGAVILAAIIMALPAFIPLKFAFEAETAGMLFFLAAMSVGILVVNAILLYVIYRWLTHVANG